MYKWWQNLYNRYFQRFKPPISRCFVGFYFIFGLINSSKLSLIKNNPIILKLLPLTQIKRIAINLILNLSNLLHYYAKMIEAVIVDDEIKALQSLSWELTNFSNEIKVSASFTDPFEALEYLEKNTPDCLFLDIEMPTMDGFQFIQKLTNKNFPVVITTAYNQYAIKALKNEAIDYLLKPIDTDDLKDTIVKIKKYNSKNYSSERLEKILLNFNANALHKKITFNTDGKLLFLESNEILYAESDGNYSTIFLSDGQKIVLTKKLKEVNDLLPKDSFFRIHNSYIINLHKIKEFLKTDGYVVLDSNHKIPVSRQKKSDFLDMI